MDKQRAKIRKTLNQYYLPFYDALCEELGEALFAPYCGYRSAADQGKLFNQGRTAPGPIVTRAQPWESPHQYACASDWCLWAYNSEGILLPHWPDKDSHEWLPYLNACEKVGLQGGYAWGDYPHNELKTGVSWKEIGKICMDKGKSEAFSVILKNLKK